MPALFSALANITGQVLLEPVPPSYSRAANYRFHEELDSGSHGKVVVSQDIKFDRVFHSLV